MSKTFFFRFGSGSPATNTGLSPTFTVFYDQAGTSLTPPAITEGLTLTGIYKFTYTPTLAIAFVIDGATTGLASSDRYIVNSLDPVLTIDQPINDTTQGVSAIGRAVTLMVAGISNLIAGYSTWTAGYSLNVAGISNIIAGQSVMVAGYSIQIAGYTNWVTGYSLSVVGLSNLIAGESVLIAGYSTLVAGYSTQIAGYTNWVTGYSLQVAGYSNLIAGESSIISGISLIAVSSGNSAILAVIGSTADSYGSTSADPSSLFGYMKRNLEFHEGNAIYTKSSNTWAILSRGSSTLLTTKTLADTASSTNKT